jgi:hypothetical protein
MTLQTVKLAGKRFVIVAENDFRDLQRRAKAGKLSIVRRVRRKATTKDRADVELARQRLADPNERPVPYEQVRRELGLA